MSSNSRYSLNCLQYDTALSIPKSCHNLEFKLPTITYAKVYKYYVDNFLLVGFTSSIAFALAYPVPGAYLSSIQVGDLNIRIVSFLNTSVLFFFNGLSLNISDLKSVQQKMPYFVYGILMINFITTLAAFVMIEIPFNTQEFSIGYAIFCIVPTTLGVGVSLTVAAKGDNVLALILTVVSNLIGAFTIPPLLKLYLANVDVGSIDSGLLVLKLVLSILIPISCGIVLRAASTDVSTFVKQHKVFMSMFGNANLFCIVWMAISVSQSIILEQSGLTIFYLIITGVLLHVIYLLFNFMISVYLFSFPIEQAVTVTIMASQKSSPVGLAVIAAITTNASQLGLLSLPCIVGQISQILIGSLIVGRLAAMVDKRRDTRNNNSVVISLNHFDVADADINETRMNDNHDSIMDGYVVTNTSDNSRNSHTRLPGALPVPQSFSLNRGGSNIESTIGVDDVHSAYNDVLAHDADVMSIDINNDNYENSKEQHDGDDDIESNVTTPYIYINNSS